MELPIPKSHAGSETKACINFQWLEHLASSSSNNSIYAPTQMSESHPQVTRIISPAAFHLWLMKCKVFLMSAKAAYDSGLSFSTYSCENVAADSYIDWMLKGVITSGARLVMFFLASPRSSSAKESLTSRVARKSPSLDRMVSFDREWRRNRELDS